MEVVNNYESKLITASMTYAEAAVITRAVSELAARESDEAIRKLAVAFMNPKLKSERGTKL